jgi:hypothetical protein
MMLSFEGGQMFRDLFNPRKRAASREFEVALHYLLHDAKAIVPLLKETYKDKWPGFIDDILKGARPYEEATLVIGIFVQNSFKQLDHTARNQIAWSIANDNLVNLPNVLRLVGQVAYLLHLAERDNYVRENCWTIWANDMAKVFVGRDITHDHCVNYLLSLANAYRDAKRAEQLAAQRN